VSVELHRSDLRPDPLDQFHAWFAAAQRVVETPEAMALATSGPSVRMVLLKGADDRGFAFFTGYLSRKAAELERDPRAALLFHWAPLGRQVRLEGSVKRISDAESNDYFASRPRGAQLAAAASRQSAVLDSRDELDARVAELQREYEAREVPRPAHWGGYRVRPDAYEFWQHRDDRMHDRFRYRRGGDGWVVERLSP
jgi:pyridoxamine 5'-phosphate oxidase